MPIPFKLDYIIYRNLLDTRSERRQLKTLAGVNLSLTEARTVWPEVLEHKWYLSERLGRDVGLRVAAIDYFENIRQAPPVSVIRTVRNTLPPRLPFMQPLSQVFGSSYR